LAIIARAGRTKCRDEKPQVSAYERV